MSCPVCAWSFLTNELRSTFFFTKFGGWRNETSAEVEGRWRRWRSWSCRKPWIEIFWLRTSSIDTWSCRMTSSSWNLQTQPWGNAYSLLGGAKVTCGCVLAILYLVKWERLRECEDWNTHSYMFSCVSQTLVQPRNFGLSNSNASSSKQIGLVALYKPMYQWPWPWRTGPKNHFARIICFMRSMAWLIGRLLGSLSSFCWAPTKLCIYQRPCWLGRSFSIVGWSYQ